MLPLKIIFCDLEGTSVARSIKAFRSSTVAIGPASSSLCLLAPALGKGSTRYIFTFQLAGHAGCQPNRHDIRTHTTCTIKDAYRGLLEPRKTCRRLKVKCTPQPIVGSGARAGVSMCDVEESRVRTIKDWVWKRNTPFCQLWHTLLISWRKGTKR